MKKLSYQDREKIRQDICDIIQRDLSLDNDEIYRCARNNNRLNYSGFRVYTKKNKIYEYKFAKDEIVLLG